LNKMRKILIPIFSIIFLTGLILLLTGVADRFDNAFMQFVTRTGTIDNKVLYTYFKFFTDIGEAPSVIVIVALFLIIPFTTKKIGITLTPIMLASWGTNTLIKNIIERARPVERFLEVSSFSFPSGHSMNSTALYMSLMILVLPLCKYKWQKVCLITLCFLFSISICVSRLYFNVHFVSDVVCGYSMGWLFALVGTGVAEKIKEKIAIKKGE